MVCYIFCIEAPIFFEAHYLLVQLYDALNFTDHFYNFVKMLSPLRQVGRENTFYTMTFLFLT